MPKPKPKKTVKSRKAAPPKPAPAESTVASPPEPAAAEPEFTPAPRPPAKIERLQKILAAAGVASRRRAEELIVQGRVEVNGKVVTVLGSKADAARDHIRVDGKLLQGPERHRYFVLNKPRGYVTTVSDPEGRPTVMQFFSKFSERLYPVGRLDYLSEGLLVVTNDGELANRLTRASSGVEKTYLVKVSGRPTEAELSALRSGVSIERDSPGSSQTGRRLRGGGCPGSPSVRTAPARIRQIRQGENPWYEVVLIEGRNRELRKMFEGIGHFVEKIRRVGYGPLVLDLEPGNIRELTPQELAALRRVAAGVSSAPKPGKFFPRDRMSAAPSQATSPKSARPSRAPQPFERFAPANERRGGFKPKNFGPARPNRPETSDRFSRKRDSRPPARNAAGSSIEGRPFSAKPTWRRTERTDDFTRPAADRPRYFRNKKFGSARPFSIKPAWKKSELPATDRSSPTYPYKSARSARPAFERSDKPRRERATGYRPDKAKPNPNSASRAEKKSHSGWKPRPAFKRSGSRPFDNRPGRKKHG